MFVGKATRWFQAHVKHVRAEMRARVAAARACHAVRMPVYSHSLVRIQASSMYVQYVAYRHDTPHGMRARGAYETSVFEHYGATSTTDVTVD